MSVRPSFLLAAGLLGATAFGQTPAQEAKHKADLESDLELGKKSAAQADKEFKASTNKEMVARVERIGAEMAEIANKKKVSVSWGDPRLNPFPYKFKVIQGKDVNAFSLPGGYIYVFEGLVNYAESDDELAGVLAHEISHAAFRHIRALQHEESKLNAITIPLILISILKGGENAGSGLVFGELLSTALGSGWSLKAETAADYGGLQYLVSSNYSPTGMLTFMERLARDERNSPKLDLGIFRTHPPSRERANAIIAHIKERHLPIRRSTVSTSLRVTASEPKDGVVQVWFGGKRLLAELRGDDAKQRADAAVIRLNRMFDDTPDLYEISRRGNALYYRGAPLLTMSDQDFAGRPAEAGMAETLKAMQGALFALNFRIWDNTGTN